MSEEKHRLYKARRCHMQPQQFNILRKRSMFLSKLLKTLIVNRLSGYGGVLIYFCGSFV